MHLRLRGQMNMTASETGEQAGEPIDEAPYILLNLLSSKDSSAR